MSSESKFTALVVDDEEIVREITALIFEENGGKTLSARGGEDALELFHSHRGRIDLVFLDFSMPGMNGFEVFTQMRSIDNSIGYLMASGLSITAAVAAAQARGEIEFLSKPFNETELMNATRRSLKKRRIIL